MAINGRLSVDGSITGRLAGVSGVAAAITSPRVVPPPTYGGIYVVTPGDEAITLETEGLVAAHNIIINPVPSTYGRVSWNGSVLTVS